MMVELETSVVLNRRGEAFRNMDMFCDGETMGQDQMAHCLAYTMGISVPEAAYLVVDYIRARERY